MAGLGPGGTGHAPSAVEPEGWRAATMLSLLLLAVLVGAGLIVFGTQLLDRQPGAQVGAPASPSPAPPAVGGASAMLAQPSAAASLATLPSASADPARLPRFPGSSVVAYDDGVDGSVSWVVIEYLAPAATLDEVREHYRGVFRESDWFVGDVDYLDGVWTFTVNQGSREARLELYGEGERVRAVAFVSDAAPAVTPRPTPVPAKAAPATKAVPETRTPRAQPPPRTQPPPRDQPPPRQTKPRPQPRDEDRPRQTPDRRPDRDNDDRDDDDDHDDDDDDDDRDDDDDDDDDD
jgi:hypothetical protein